MNKTLQILLMSFLVGITGITSAQVTLPYYEDFEAGDGGWTTASLDTLTLWQYGTPNYNINSGAHSGNYCWDINLDTSYFDNAECSITSPTFSTGSATILNLSFWMNYNTEDTWDGVRLEMSTNAGPWEVVSELNAAQTVNASNWYTDQAVNSSNLPGWEGAGLGWHYSSIQLLNVANSDLQFRFVFNSDGSVDSSGVSIDDFSLMSAPPEDMKAIAVYAAGNAGVIGSVSDSVRILVVNYGAAPATGFTVSYTYNGTTVTSQAYTGSLNSSDSATVALAPFTIGSLPLALCASVTMPGDTISANDSTCSTFVAVTNQTLSFSDNFDTGSSLFIPIRESQIGSEWQLGTPNYGTTNISYSAPACWDIDLDSAYVIFTRASLYTPNFDCSNTVSPAIDFYINYYTELNYDGMYVEYSTDAGRSWGTLGTLGDPNALNWYSVDSLTGNGNPAWSGTTSGYIHCRYNLSGIGNPSSIMLRFIFIGDYSINYDGLSLDNFSISSTTGLTEELSNSVFVYPNPAREDIYLKNLPSGIKKIRLQDAAGKEIQQLTSTSTDDKISISHLEPGIYLLLIENQDGKISVQKIIKS